MIGANQRLIFSGEQAGCEIGWEALNNVDNVHKAIFMKNLLDFSDDFARRAAKSHFWNLDNDNSTGTNPGTPSTNQGIAARHLLTNAGKQYKLSCPSTGALSSKA